MAFAKDIQAKTQSFLYTQTKPGCHISQLDTPKFNVLKAQEDGVVVCLLMMSAIVTIPVYEDINTLPENIRKSAESAMAHGVETRLSDDTQTN